MRIQHLNDSKGLNRKIEADKRQVEAENRKNQKDYEREEAKRNEQEKNKHQQLTDQREGFSKLRRLIKEKDIAVKKANNAQQRLDELSMRKEEIDINLKEHIKKQDMMQKRVEDKKKDINAKIHERKLLNGDLVTQEEQERKAKDEVQMHEQQLTKIRFKKQSYALAMQKLQQQNIKLEKDKENYADQATTANARYYQCLEQVKLKNNLIAKL